MKKNTARNSAVSTLLLALSAAFILAGCFNPLDTVDPAPQSGAGALSVSIAGQGGEARTLYPDAAFTKYVLTFASAAGESYGPQTLTGTSTAAFNDIPAGDWTITATGYVTINGQEYAAAEGSKTASITAGQTASVNIPISAEQGGDNGYFYYNVTFPAAKVDTAALTLSRYNYYTGSYSVVSSVDLKTSASGYVSEGAGSGLKPGYYRVDVRLENGYQSAGVSEVVHIYSNMETKAEYAYAEDDFVDIVTMSGTINAAINGEAPDYVDIYAYADGNAIGSTSVYPYSSGAEWSISVPAFGAATTVTFRVDFYTSNYSGSVSNLSSTKVHNSAVSGIELNVDYSYVTLSGTINAAVDGEAPDYVNIYAYAGDNEIGSTWGHSYSSGAEWSIHVPAFSAATTVTFKVDLYDSSGYIDSVSDLSSTQVHNESVSGIALNVDYHYVTLSGTIGAVTVDGAAYSGDIWIGAYNQNGAFLRGTNSQSVEWTISIPPTHIDPASTTSISFNVEIDIGGSYLIYDIPAATQTYTGQSISGIVLGDVSFSTSSSGVSSITYSSVSGSDMWTIENDGRYRSPAIDHDTTTKARVSFISAGGSVIVIQLDVSSESYCDVAFISTLDNASATNYSGYYPNSTISGEGSVMVMIPVATAGSHFVDIGYRKDGSANYGSDCAWFKVIE